MSTTTSDAMNRLTRLTRDAVETQTRLAREYAELARAVLTGDGDRVVAGRAYLGSVRRESEQYWRAISDLGYGYAEDVLRLGIDAGDAVARDVGSAVHRPTSTAETTPAEVALTAALGATVTTTVTVANKHNRDRRVAVTPGPWTDANGDVIDAELDADPRIVTVPAGGEVQVTLTVVVTAPAFAAGQRYTARIDVSGATRATVLAALTVES
jgi:hypothetical protein